MDPDSEIYEPYDHHQREKSTGSGLVLAVPAMVLDTKDEQVIEMPDLNLDQILNSNN